MIITIWDSRRLVCDPERSEGRAEGLASSLSGGVCKFYVCISLTGKAPAWKAGSSREGGVEVQVLLQTLTRAENLRFSAMVAVV